MALVPETASDSMIESLWELLALRIQQEHAEMLKADPTLAARLDADPELQSVTADKLLESANHETVRPGLGDVLAEKLADVMQSGAEIDLRGKDYDLRYEFHGTFRGKQQWTCFDANKQDSPESYVGEGESKEDALQDFMDKNEEEAPKPRASRVIHSSPFEPPEYKDDRRDDPDEDNNDGR